MATKTIVIDGPIGQYSFSKQFMRNELAGQSKNPILIKIGSLGGSVDDVVLAGQIKKGRPIYIRRPFFD